MKDAATLRQSILTFAHFLGAGRSEADAARAATERRWIDASGAPTQDGLALVKALGDQRTTRTVWRSLA